MTMARKRRMSRGQMLVSMYMVVMVLTILGGAFLTRGMTGTTHSQIQELDAEVFYLAQGGLEDAGARFANAIAQFNIDANAVCYPDTNGDIACNPNPATQTDVLVTTVCTSDACASSPFPAGSNPRALSWLREAEPAERTVIEPDGTRVYLKNYEITTQAAHPQNPNLTIRLHQVITRRMIYTFQHAVFYQDDLEMLPGENMTLSGRIHSNHDIYVATQAGRTLTVNSEYLRSVGQIFNRRKDSGASMLGDVSIKVAGSSPATYNLMAGLDSPDATWTSESQTRWNGTVKSDVHGVTALSVPAVGTTTPGGFYDSKAGVKITNDVITKGGTTLVPGSTIPPGTISTTSAFWNNREAAFVRMTDIDVRKLAGWYDCDSDGDEEQCYPNHLADPLFNGLIYATRDDAPAGQQPGIRLVKGSEIARTAGLTVVSNDPLYIKGDYNTVNKKPTAVISDALNILSNAWNDANSTVNNVNSGSPRTASNTTVNTAFIAGIKTTASGNYNGGLENYPRFHERWSGQTLTIRGSFVALWNSVIGTGNWKYGQQSSNSQYTAPIRNWDYDTDFSSGPMPPFTPWAIETRRGAWWRE